MSQWQWINMYKSHVYIFQCHKSTVSQKPSMECLLQKRSLLQSKNAFSFYLLRPIVPGRAWAIDNPLSAKLTWAFHSTSFQLLQAVSGTPPLILFPWEFHLRACRVMLFSAFCRVRPIQPHFRLEFRTERKVWSYIIHVLLWWILQNRYRYKIRVQVTLCQKWKILVTRKLHSFESF